MSLHEFMAAQAQNAQTFSQAPHFASLVPLVDRMYTTACRIASERHSPTLVKLMMVCHREFLVAASQIQRGLPFDSHANTRRAVEIAKVALAVKRNRANADKWLKADCGSVDGMHARKERSPNACHPTAFLNWTGNPW